MVQPLLKISGVVFDPVPAAGLPNNALGIDSTGGDALTLKQSGGTEPISSGGSATSPLLKVMQNLSGSTILQGKPVAKKADGSIIQGDSDGVGTQVIIGVAMENIADSATGVVALVGPNVVGAITGLGFAPGAAIYISETGGYTDSLASFTGDNDTVVRIGYADCAEGNASATATDLVMFAEVVAVAA